MMWGGCMTPTMTGRIFRYPPGRGGGHYDNYDNQWVGQMTTPQDSPRMGDLVRPAKSRLQLLQELKVARMEKVRIHRVQRREAAASRAQTQLGSPPAPAPALAQPWYSTGSTPPRGTSLDTNGIRAQRGVVIKGRGVSCPRLAGAGIYAEKKASALP